MTSAGTSVTYRSPLHEMTQTTPTCLWNDSAAIDELTYAIDNGAVGATCNPVIAAAVLAGDSATWRPRAEALIRDLPAATEDTIAWKLVEELSIRAAKLLEPIFETHRGRNGRLSIQTDPRVFRDSDAIVKQALAFSRLAPNMIVKIPATRAGIPAIEEATYQGVSVNATVSFTLPQCLAVAEAVERGLERREAEGKEIASMGPVCTIMVGRLDDWLKVVMEREGIASTPGISNGPALRCSRRRTGHFASAGTESACSRRRFATTCTGVSSSAPMPSSRRHMRGRGASMRATSRSSLASTTLSIRRLLPHCSRTSRTSAARTPRMD